MNMIELAIVGTLNRAKEMFAYSKALVDITVYKTSVILINDYFRYSCPINISVVVFSLWENRLSDNRTNPISDNLPNAAQTSDLRFFRCSFGSCNGSAI